MDEGKLRAGHLSRVARRIWHYPHTPAILLWTALWAGTFLTLLSGQARLGVSDFTEQFHTFAVFQAREMAAGRLPLWSDGSYGGFPFFADPQSATFYWPRWLTILLSPRDPLPLYSLELEALLHIWLTGLFTYGFAFRETGRRSAAIVAAIGFGLGGYLIAYPLLQLAILETITWLPLALLCLRQLVDAAPGRPARRWLAATALVMATAIAAGHPQTFLQFLYLSAAYYLYQTAQRRGRRRRLLARGLAVGLLAMGLAAVSWLPAIRYALATARASVDYAFVSSGAPLLDFLQLVVPNSLSLWVPQYGSLAIFILALVALFHRTGDRGHVRFWAGVALLAGWLSLGDRGILFELAYRVFPGFSLFRQQERWLSLFSFALVMLAAHGAADLSPRDRRPLLKAGIVTTGLLALAVVIMGFAPSLAPAGWPALVGRQVLIGSVTGALLLGVGRRPRLWLPLCLVMAADLALATAPGLGRQAGSPATFWSQPSWLDVVRDAGGRIDSGNVFWSNFGELDGVADIRGISPLRLKAIDQIERLPEARRWELLGVTHVIRYEPPEGLDARPLEDVWAIKPPHTPTGGRLYALDSPLPLAWVAHEIVVEPDEEAAMAILADEAWDVRRQVILPASPALAGPATAPSAATVSIVARRPGHLELQVTSAAPGILVVSQWHYPGWRALVNGVATTLLPANLYLQGLALPAGSSEVVLTYRPLELFVGLGLSLLAGSLALLALWSPGPLRRELPRPPGAVPAAPAPATGAATAVRHRRRTAAIPSETAWIAAMLGILLLAYGLRLTTAASQELRGDEAFSVAVTNGPPGEIVATLIATSDPHPPLHYFLLEAWRSVAGDSELALRLSAIWPSLLLVALVARLGRDLGTRRLGLLAAGLMAVSLSQVWIGHDLRNQYVLALCFVLWASLLLWRRQAWWLYGLAATLTVYSHYFGIFPLLAHGVFLLSDAERRRDFWRWLAAGIAAAALFLPWLWLMYETTLGTHLLDRVVIDLGEHISQVGVTLTVGHVLAGGGRRWLFLLGLLLALVGARRWPRRSGQDGRAAVGPWLLAWLGLTVIGLYLIRLNREIYNDFYAVIAAPAWWLLIASGLLALRAWPAPRPAAWRGWARLLATAALALLVLANAVSLVRYLNDTITYGRTRGYRALAAHLRAAANPEDLLLLHAPDPSLSYYLGDLALDQALQPADFNLSDDAINAAVAATVAPYPRIWFVPVDHGIRDPTNAVTRWLDYHLLHEETGRFVDLTLNAYRPVDAALAISQPLLAAVGDDFQLEAAYLTLNGQPLAPERSPTLCPGDELAVTLIWWVTASTTVSDNYAVFIHLLNPNGQLIGQHDGVPLFGTRPTSTWIPGERLLDRHVLTVGATPGPAQLVAGLYDAATLERAVFADGATQQALLNADVAPCQE